MGGQATSVVVAPFSSSDREASGPRRHLRGAVSSWAPLLTMSLSFAVWPRSRVYGRPLNKWTLTQGSPAPYRISSDSQGLGGGQPKAAPPSPREAYGDSLPPSLLPAAWVSVCSVRPGLLSVGTNIRLDSGKISLCPFYVFPEGLLSARPWAYRGVTAKVRSSPSEGNHLPH